eukprot:m.181891 g.181891  ORF g.181891 m.181891 type:complete len:836 (+) comp32086_c0_seq1:276-2783(+)
MMAKSFKRLMMLVTLTLIIIISTVTADPLADLLESCATEHTSLLAETNSAEAAGLPVYLERSTLEVTRYFMLVAASDNGTNAQDVIRKHYEAFYFKAEAGVADTLAASLPVREANDTLHTLQRARAILAQTTLATRLTLPSRDLTTASICNGYFCNSQGIPVFGAGFNVFDDGGAAPFNAVSTGVTVNTVGFAAAYLYENLTWPTVLIERARDTLEQANAINQTIHILMGQSMPDWAEKKWPGLNTGNFTSHGFSYDIDNPGAAIVTSAAINAFLDVHGCNKAFGGWIMANEPDFSISGTPYTMAKYRTWLNQRYNSNVTRLNHAWNTTYAAIDNISTHPAQPSWKDPLVLGGEAAEWWDWNNFNNLRVAQFFKHIYDDIHAWKGGPTTARCVGTTIKAQDGNLFNTHAGKGINRTALIGLQTINGNDAPMAPTGATIVGSNAKLYTKPTFSTPNYMLSNYVADWVCLAAGYALQRSLDFTKPVYNTEWHGVGTLAWRDEHMTPEYVNVAVWLGLYHGEAMNMAWYFPRSGIFPQNANQFADSFTGSFGTLPAVTDMFLRAFFTASTHGSVVASLNRIPPRVWLLRSLSSFTLNHNSSTTLVETFEVTSFLGMNVGFLFEDQLNGIGDTDVVLIPGSTHAQDNTVAWLSQRSLQHPGTVVRVYDAMCDPDTILAYDPTGVARSAADVAFLKKIPDVKMVTSRTALTQFVAIPAVSELRAATPARCVNATVFNNHVGDGGVDNGDGVANGDNNGEPPFGVLCKWAVVLGRVRGLVINLNVVDVDVRVVTSLRTSSPISAIDMMEGVVVPMRGVDNTQLQLSPSQVLLIDAGPAQTI